MTYQRRELPLEASMTPPANETHSEPSLAAALIDSSVCSQGRPLVDVPPMRSSQLNLPYRKSNNSASPFSASTISPAGSSSISPNGGLTSVKTVAGPDFPITPGADFLRASHPGDDLGLRNLIIQAYVPHIAVYTSADTDELAAHKGFRHGLWQLLRPFGEHIQGKVNVRDSSGSSRVYNDFAVRFVRLGDGLQTPSMPVYPRNALDGSGLGLGPNELSELKASPGSGAVYNSWTGGDLEAIENVIERHLSHAETISGSSQTDPLNKSRAELLSPFYMMYLRRLLSGIPIKPHETFSHPVACIIAISSRNTSPIEALRRLYDESSRGDKRLPVWVNSEYLRYYVLVHDEERDDITESMKLFEQMKRNFGLHCHLLRLRSSQCVLTDDDSVRFPSSEWISASEELANIYATDVKDDGEDRSPCIFDSDVTALRTFIREMVTQSIVPLMERCVSTWNDQVASRRRGISGRFISITRKWAGIGSTSRNSSLGGASGNTTGPNSNYDSLQGFYPPNTPEAVMRKLADYAFMLRDWKLAQSTYDLVRADFSSDKAWEYHAAANEMTAVSTLLMPQVISSKIRSEPVDQMLETAAYSYVSRCRALYGALRSLIMGMELLRIHGGFAVDDAVKWGSRILENKIIGSVGEALVKERIAVCYASRKGVGPVAWSVRSRKAALWNILAADDWLNLGKYKQAERRLIEVRRQYDTLANRESLSLFLAADTFLSGLEREVYIALLPNAEKGIDQLMKDGVTDRVDEESEALDIRTHRKSLVGASAPQLTILETAPLHQVDSRKDLHRLRDGDFE